MLSTAFDPIGDDRPSSSSTSATTVAADGADDGGVVHVGAPVLLLSAVPLLCIACAGRKFDLGLENALIVGIVRSFVQLTILGSILHPIFVLGMDSPWLVFLYVLFMIIITTKESLSRAKYTYRYQAPMTFLAFFVSITAVGAFAFLFIIRPVPRWNPQYVIPICGMLMGNCINGVSLTTNDLSTQIMEGGRREIELYLSFGAGGWESVRRLAKGAIGTGATPIMNGLNVIGLVSIPGMMTGQILGGSPVTEAARYQILITWCIATCTFLSIIVNVFILYRVAFDVGAHVLRTDRFLQVAKRKKNQSNGNIIDKLRRGVRQMQKRCTFLCCRGPCGRQQDVVKAIPDILEARPLSSHPDLAYYGTGTGLPNKIQIQTRQLGSDGLVTTPFFRISNLQFSVPESSRLTSSQSSPSLPVSASDGNQPSNLQLQPQPQQRRVLCTNLSASLNRGEIGIVTGPSGSGKSTLLRVLSGLALMDHGDVFMCDSSIAGSREGMVKWRAAVRYMTQYKVDIPGTPRDFILRIGSFCSPGADEDEKRRGPSADEMASHALSYLEDWGMGDSGGNRHNGAEEHHPYLDKEWKDLSGGESQRSEFIDSQESSVAEGGYCQNEPGSVTILRFVIPLKRKIRTALLAIAMASRPSVLLMDEATSGLDPKTERRVEESVVDYAKEHRAAVLWVTHSEDIAERLLKR